MPPEHPEWRAGSHGGASLAPEPIAADGPDLHEIGGRAGVLAATRVPCDIASQAPDREAEARRMLRIIHTADVHLGARHDDLGDQAAAQRERQFAAFVATVDLAIAEKVDVVLVAGDLFDSNVQPRRSVERVAEQLKRLGAARVRTVVIPGTHDCYDRSSIYRAYDLKRLAGSNDTDDLVTILRPDVPLIHLAACDVVVHGPVFATKRAPHSPLRDVHADSDAHGATWHVGMVHGSIAIPGRTDADDVVVRTEEIAATGLDYLALGHWHSTQQGKAGGVTYAYSGAPEAVAVDQDGAGKVLLVELDGTTETGKTVRITERTVGRTRFERVDIDTATLGSQPALIESLLARADPDLVLDVRLIGVRPDELDTDVDEIETAIAGRFLKARVRDLSSPALTEGALPPADTITGSFIRDLEARIAELEARTPAADEATGIADDAAGGDTSADEAAELRDALRLGRLLLAGHEVHL